MSTINSNVSNVSEEVSDSNGSKQHRSSLLGAIGDRINKRRHSHTPGHITADMMSGNSPSRSSGSYVPFKTSSARGFGLSSLAAPSAVISRPTSANSRRKTTMAVESPNKFRHSVVA